MPAVRHNVMLTSFFVLLGGIATVLLVFVLLQKIVVQKVQQSIVALDGITQGGGDLTKRLNNNSGMSLALWRAVLICCCSNWQRTIRTLGSQTKQLLQSAAALSDIAQLSESEVRSGKLMKLSKPAMPYPDWQKPPLDGCQSCQ